MFKTRSRQQRRCTIMGIVIPTVLISFPVSARAQVDGGSADTVKAIASAFFNAVVGGRWNDASPLLDTISLKAIRRESAEYTKRWRATRPLTAERFMQMNPEMPRAVAAYRAKEANERTRALAKALGVYGVEDPDSLLAMPIESYASRWLEIRDERWLIRESARRCGHGVLADIPLEPYRVIASFPADSVAYVLFDPGAARSPGVNPMEPRVPRVMLLRRRGAAWSIVPRDDLIGMGEMVNACG